MQNKWCTIAPVNSNYSDTNNCLKNPIIFSNAVVLAKTPKWFKEFSTDKDLGLHDRLLIESAEYVICKEYQASNLGDPDPEWKGPESRTIQKAMLEQIQRVNLALWVAKPTCIGFSLVIDAMYGESKWFLMEPKRIDGLVPHNIYKNASLTEEDIEEAKSMCKSLCKLNSGSVWQACVSLHWALTTKNWDHRYLNLWIALESLFGPDDPKEITYRMSQRIAFFLAENRAEARNVFELAKKGYKWRSKIVHGRSLDSLDAQDSEQMLFAAEDLIRRSLNQILDDTKLIKKFNSHNRESYLDNLVFSA